MIVRFPATVILFMLGLLAAPAAMAQAPDGLAEIDRLRADGQFEDALARLEALADRDPDDVEVLWRLAWTRVDLGEEMGGAEAREFYREALTEARHAVGFDPADANANMVRAMAAGRVALQAGTREKIELSREVKEAADAALAHDPMLDGAYHIRGRWHHEVASLGFFTRSIVRLVYGGLPDASYEAAAGDFRRAIDIRDRTIHRMELGRTLLAIGDRAAAREQLLRAIEMPDDDPDAPRHREEARRLLDQIR